MSSAPAIGIDLGTTFSLVAVCRNGKSEVIPNKEGQRLTPSVIFYHPESLEVTVGTTAEDMEPEYKENVLFDQKRIIGRKYHDVYVQEKIKNNPDYKFKIVSGEEDKAKVELTHDGLKVYKSPEQACSEILKYLRECASEYLGTDVTEAVISIPAHFSNAQRKATKTAAELAGLTVLKLITEPVAGAIYYTRDRLETEATLLVFDFGGGTLDVSIIDVNEKTFQVKSVEGDTFLGGRDFDKLLMDYFKDEMVQKFGAETFITMERLLSRLRKHCIHIKQKLTTKESYYINIPLVFGKRKKCIEHKLGMSRTQFETVTKHLLTDSLKVVEKCLKEAGLSKYDISDVLLVGETTRIPKIREMLQSYFEIEQLLTDLNPDEAVALGAAIQAASLKNDFRDLEKYEITEVTPLSIGFALSGNLMRFVIKKNTPLPFKSERIRTVTTYNNQSSCKIEIFEGERKNCDYNNLLGSFSIDNIPKGMAGEIEFEETYLLNEDGILEVEAFETTTGKGNKLVVTIGEYRLCENKLKNINNDAEKNLKEDDIFEKFILYKTEVEEKCQHVLYYLNHIRIEIEREFVEKQCNAFTDFMENLKYTEINSLREKYKHFRNIVKPIIEEYNIDVDLTLDTSIFDSVINRIRNTTQQFQSINTGSSSKIIQSTKKSNRNNKRRRKKRFVETAIIF